MYLTQGDERTGRVKDDAEFLALRIGWMGHYPCMIVSTEGLDFWACLVKGSSGYQIGCIKWILLARSRVEI